MRHDGVEQHETEEPDAPASARADEDEARRHREQVLHDLASKSAPTTSPARIGMSSRLQPRAGTPPSQRVRRSQLLKWLIPALLLLAVVGGVLAYVLRPAPHATVAPASPAPPAQLVFVPRVPTGPMYPVDIAWSPKADQIAVLDPSYLAIFDSATGARLAFAQLDPIVVPEVRAAVAAAPTPIAGSSGSVTLSNILYQLVLWSPDGGNIAVLFEAVATPSGSRSGTLISGVLVMDARNQHPRVLVHVGGSPAHWDLRAGIWLGADPLPAALGYSWGEGGQLVPQTPLIAGTAPPVAPGGPVGLPSGGSSFTVWQPGDHASFLVELTDGGSQAIFGEQGGAQLVLQTPSHQQIETPGVYTWQTAFAAWSPDGRYLVGPLLVDERLQPQGRPVPSAQTLTDFGSAQWPLLPVRDAALEQILLALSTTATSSIQQLAWRPDGRVLAVQPLAFDATEDPASVYVSFYDTDTGRELGMLHTQAGGSFLNDINYLRWSPDGKRLLVFDHRLGTITIWGSGLLPQ